MTKPLFLMIDEGWGNLDENNIKNIPMIYDIFRREFRFTILITHEVEFKSLVDIELGIELDTNKYSMIEYN